MDGALSASILGTKPELFNPNPLLHGEEEGSPSPTAFLAAGQLGGQPQLATPGWNPGPGLLGGPRAMDNSSPLGFIQHKGGAMKRGSEEILSHSPLVTNGTGMSPTQTEAANDAKKVKLDGANSAAVGKPSRVLHFRGVPSDATEGEIVQLGLPFGRMTNLVLAKKKNQALLEMGDVASAQTMVNYYTERPPTVRSRTVYVQFSNHEVLKTESSQQNAGAQAALQAANQLMSNMEEPKTVLRVIIEHMLYPVTIDVIKQIFSRYGQVLKIVTFSKNNTFQALIQYSDAIAAQTAKVSLNGQNIYNGCCTLRIDFSKLPSLNVKYNNDKSRDYTNPNLPSGDGQPGMPVDALGFGGNPALSAAMMSAQAHAAQVQAATGSPFSAAATPHSSLPGLQSHSPAAFSFAPAGHHHHHHPAGIPGLQGSGDAPMGLGKHQGMMGSGMKQEFQGGMPHQGGGGADRNGNQALANRNLDPTMHAQLQAAFFLQQQQQQQQQQQHQHQHQRMQAPQMPFGLAGLPGSAALTAAAAGLRMPGHTTTGSVLLVSNLNEEKVTPDALFTLFGVYGDVIRVKIMFNKKDNALIQFSDGHQAQCAMTHIDKIKCWGKQIKVAPSKHAVVQMPKEGQPDAGLTKDYTNSPLHRFKKPNSKNHHNIFPPSATLHLSNIPPTTEEDGLKELFVEHGEVVAFKFFQKDRKMALIQMSTIEEAVHALIATHNHQLAETSHLRVSFSKSTIQPASTLPAGGQHMSGSNQSMAVAAAAAHQAAAAAHAQAFAAQAQHAQLVQMGPAGPQVMLQ